VDRQWVKCGPYLQTRSAFYPRAIVTSEVRFPVYKAADYTCNSCVLGRPLIVGIAQLAYAAGKSIFCREVWRRGSSKKTLGCQRWRISHCHSDTISDTVLDRDIVTCNRPFNSKWYTGCPYEVLFLGWKLSRDHFLPLCARAAVQAIVVCLSADMIKCVPHFDVIEMSEDTVRTRCNRYKLLKHCHCDVKESGELRCLTVPNFIKIGPTVCEISRFFSIFQDDRHRHLRFLNFWYFISWRGPEDRDASSIQISSKSVNALWRYIDFTIFQ